MDWEKIAREISIKTDSKIILLVLDGMGGLPMQGKTELEAAHTPNLDRLAAESVCGLADPIFMGITPGSGPAHLSLFGYDPLKYLLGRGILEALGSGVEVAKNDVVARGNFATLKDNLVVDRRAGRIPTSENEKLCQRLNSSLKSIEGVEITVFPGKEHRFVARFSGEGLSDALSDADPQKENKPRAPAQALSKEAAKTAQVVNDFIDEVTELLKDSTKASTILLRGFSKHPSIPSIGELYKLKPAIPSIGELYKLKPAAIATYPMYKGLARLAGMEILATGQNLPDLFASLEENYKDYDFFYVHMKKTDAAGEDGNPRLLNLKPEVLVVTSDHSTPSLLKSHSWHPNPFLLFSKASLVDKVSRFTEKECSQGYLGRFQAIYAMPLMLAHAGKLKKFGA
jgi:2,3-bisphosphoglycerate-independent phosphoglycerate mutase